MVTNLLLNGSFDGNLDRWSGDGTIERSQGYPRPGCAALAAGQALESEVIGLSEDQLYTLHYFYRLTSGGSFTIGYGNTTQTHVGAPFDVWSEGTFAFALDTGDNSGVRLSAAGGLVYVDTVALLIGGLPCSRYQLATMVAAQLRGLATSAGLLSNASEAGPNGDYTVAIDEGLRAVGAVNRHGDPDVTQLAPRQINDAVEAAKAAMLQALRADYALKTDVQLGPRRESRSQIAESIDKMLSGGGANNRPAVTRLRHEEWPR